MGSVRLAEEPVERSGRDVEQAQSDHEGHAGDEDDHPDHGGL